MDFSAINDIFVHMKIKTDQLNKIILQPEIQKIFDHFASGFNIIILFYTVNGQVLKTGLNQGNSIFCRKVEKLYGLQKCVLLDEKMQHECGKTKKIIHYQCHVGIEEAVAPIFIDGQLVGYAMIGQFRSTHKIDNKLQQDWSRKHNLSELKKAFKNLPYFNPTRIHDILGMFAMLVDYIVTKEIVAIRGNPIISRVLTYIEENIHRKITLEEVAQSVGRSHSGITHLFKKELGMSFKEALIEAKLTKAEDYLKNSPDMSIQEVASLVGFDDQFYFSRLFRKYRGSSPSKFKSVQGLKINQLQKFCVPPS